MPTKEQIEALALWWTNELNHYKGANGYLAEIEVIA